jgi:hypothetical protein
MTTISLQPYVVRQSCHTNQNNTLRLLHGGVTCGTYIAFSSLFKVKAKTSYIVACLRELRSKTLSRHSTAIHVRFLKWRRCQLVGH